MTMRLPSIRHIALIVFLTFLSMNALAAVDSHYVTANGGQEPRDGTSWANAFSQADFENGVNWDSDVDDDDKIGPGDTVYFRGDFTASRINVFGSGISGYPITLDGYQEGSYDAINRHPSPDNLAKISTPNYGMKIAGKRYITVQDFEFDGNNGAMLDGIVVYNYLDNLASSVTIRDCYFHHLGQRGVLTGRSSDAYEIANEHIVIGGAPGDGNEFYAVGKNTASYDVKMNFVRDWVVSYNKMHAPQSGSEFGNSGISWGDHRNEAINGLVEYNYVCCHNSVLKAEDGIGGKGGNNIIIRYNHVLNHHSAGEGTGIQACWGDSRNMYVYGNLIENNEWGVWVTSGSREFNKNGIPCENIYIWGNIISDTKTGDGIRVGGWDGEDLHNNIYIYNNVIARNAINPINRYNGKTSTYTGISVVRTTRNVNIVNNILYDNRPNAESEIRSQIYVQAGLEAEVKISDNIYYHGSGTPTVYFDSKYKSADSVGSANIVGDPQFTKREAGIYTISKDSHAYASGKSLGGMVGFVAINGRVHEMFWSDSLDPVEMDWTGIIPKIKKATMGSDGNAWSMGAYATAGAISPPRILNISVQAPEN